jgi:hypothetical protein
MLARGNYLSVENRLLTRRPPGSAPVYDTTSLGSDYILRACALVRQGRIGIVLVESGRYYIGVDPSDPWGSKESISHDALRALIDSIEATKEVAA